MKQGGVLVWGRFSMLPADRDLDVRAYLSSFMAAVYPLAEGHGHQDNAPCHKGHTLASPAFTSPRS